MAKNANKNNTNKKSVEEKEKKIKARNWATVIYPDSLPENWEQIIRLSGLRCALSPLHDKDVNEDKEEEKKAHYHLIFIWNNGSTTLNVANQFVKKLNGIKPQPLGSVRGYYRYFTHEDNPEKHHYDVKDIKLFNDFDINDYVERTKSENIKLKKELINYIEEKNIFYYSDLILKLIDEHLNDFFDIASSHTLFLSSYLKSKQYRYLNGDVVKRKEQKEDAKLLPSLEETSEG